MRAAGAGLAADTGAPHTVIVGGGFGGLEAARALGRAGLPVTLIDRFNHHLFQPLLYQVATASLAASSIAVPIRKALRRYPSVQVLLGEVTDIDPHAFSVRLRDGARLPYDMLILASGARHSYFGNDEWARFAPGLKTLADAREIRARILLAFERAERSLDPVRQRRLMSMAVIGGGPTGVELAASLAELSRYTLARDFHNITARSSRITLVEAGERLLPGFSRSASDYARERLERLGVEVVTRSPVEAIDDAGIGIAGRHVPAGVVLWAAGVAASPLAGLRGARTDRSGRVKVDETLAVRGLRNVFAIGDAAHSIGEDGAPLPGLAQVAKQQGRHLGRTLARHLHEGAPLIPFRYRGRGMSAIIGRNAAIYEHGRFSLTGWLAWLGWAMAHVYLLSGAQQKLVVSLQWLWRYATYERGARLVTEDAVPDTVAGALTPAAKQPRAHDETV